MINRNSLGTFQPIQVAFEMFPAQEVLLHLGAHIGEELEQYISMGFKEICWVEAQPIAFQTLISRVNERFCLQTAVWHSSGEELDFFRSKNSVSSSLLNLGTQNPWDQAVQEDHFKVHTSTIDDVIYEFNNRGLLRNDIALLLDLQGAEYQALKGLNKYSKSIKYICCEVTRKKDIYKGSYRRIFIVLKLLKFGFLPAINKINPIDGHGETLFMRPMSILKNLNRVFKYRLISTYLLIAYIKVRIFGKKL